MLQRNLVYTGVTRGRKLVVLVGQRKALAIAVAGQQVRRRWSKLREWLATPAGAEDPRYGNTAIALSPGRPARRTLLTSPVEEC